LDETNPEIKSFIQKIANQELEEYRRKLKEYNELIKNMAPTPFNARARIQRELWKVTSSPKKMLLISHYDGRF
jgi:HSP90 family molecular chaperone